MFCCILRALTRTQNTAKHVKTDEVIERNAGMTIRAVVFDIGGVLEITPPTGWVEQWEARLHLNPGELDARLMGVWRAGTLGTISLQEVEMRIGQIMGLDQQQVAALMADLWKEYLGELNVELAAYFASLRPHYQTALLSNSFAGARDKEQERYHFADLCDLLIYSHEEGTAKPDRRIFELTCERLGLQPEEIVFLDDVEANIAVAREFGMQAILFRETSEAIAALHVCLQAPSPAIANTVRPPSNED
jgi:epoxide hydrolase-like predicted phosphatase